MIIIITIGFALYFRTAPSMESGFWNWKPIDLGEGDADVFPNYLRSRKFRSRVWTNLKAEGGP